MSNPLLLEEVESFVRTERGLSKSKVITAATTLEDDLGITGIEGEMFMEAFFARFKVGSPPPYRESGKSRLIAFLSRSACSLQLLAWANGNPPRSRTVACDAPSGTR
jgi:hypothetical protein